MKYKLLKGAAHNIGHSFVSLMNWDKRGIPIISLIGNRVLESGQSKLEIDLMTGTVTPVALTSKPITASIKRYVGKFGKFLQSHKVSIDVLKKANLIVQFFPEKTRPSGDSRYIDLPFRCEVSFVDDKGKIHVGRVKEDATSVPLPHPVVQWFKRKLRGKI